MWHVAIELHDVSLRLMRRLMHIMLLLPPRPLAIFGGRAVKIVYTVILFVYLGLIARWRIGNNYHVIFDIRIDKFSSIVDKLNFAALTTCHIVVALELLWSNRSQEIEQQLSGIREQLQLHFGHAVNLSRIRNCCNAIYVSLILRGLLMLVMSIYSNLMLDDSKLLYMQFYSEMVLFTRFNELSLYTLLIMVFYEDLLEVAATLRLEMLTGRLERTKSLIRLTVFQQIHNNLWNTLRLIESHFEVSSVVVLLKLFWDCIVLPYWIFINTQAGTKVAAAQYCAAEELCKLMEVIVPCYICNRCELLQRRLRSSFRQLNSHADDQQLNRTLWHLQLQLGQETCQISAGGFSLINHATLGKFIFGMGSYIVICIQFRLLMLAKSPQDADEKSNLTMPA